MREDTQLSPLPRERLLRLLGARGHPARLVLRRAAAAILLGLAILLALRPTGGAGPPTAPVLVAAHDLAPGVTLSSADLSLRQIPSDLLPQDALCTVGSATGRVVGAAMRAGEPFTDLRLLSPADTALAAGGSGAAAVAVRLADPGIADLLHPGTRVDVVTVNPDQPQDSLLASDASVLTVRDTDSAPGQSGRLVVLALPPPLATRVAATSLRQPVTVTLR